MRLRRWHSLSGRRPPRLVMIVADYVPAVGGTTTQARLHAREFARRGWDVTILTRRITWRHSRDLVDGLAVRRVGSPGRGRLVKVPLLIALWWWLLVRRRQITAVSVIMEADFALCAEGAGLARATTLTWVTDGDVSRFLSGRRGRIRYPLLQRCTHVALTQRMQAELQEHGVSPVHVIAVPVDTARFHSPTDAERAKARHTLNIGSEPVMTFVGHLQERKGVGQLLAAVKKLRDAGRVLTVLLVGGPVEAGDAQYVAKLKEFVQSSGLTGSVRFIGPQQDVVPYLFAADLFCLASQREGMPNVLLEAMACGVPCVAPQSAGGDALLSSGAGCIPASNAPDHLAAAIDSLLSHEAVRESLAGTALDRVMKDHSIQAIVDDYERIIGVQRSSSDGVQAIDGEERTPTSAASGA